MIENYAIDPDDLLALLPNEQIQRIGESMLRETLEKAAANWLQHGALASVLHERGAGDFRSRTSGYPNRLLNPPYAPVTDELEIESWLRKWYDALNPDQIMPAYRQRLADFHARSTTEQYRNCIDGKMFFQEIVCQQVLNRPAGKRECGKWLEELFKARIPSHCPPDLMLILTRLVQKDSPI